MARALSRRKLAQYVADQLEAGSKTVALQLAAYLIESRRTKELDLIIRDVAAVFADRGILTGAVISAFELEADTKNAITSLVAKQFGEQSVTLSYETDNRLIGGYKVELPGYELDRTVRKNLITLKTQLKKA